MELTGEYMDFFIDTNVALGFSIIPDKWHDKSRVFFEENLDKDIYWSNLVKEEYLEKSIYIALLIRDFLQKIQYILENSNKRFINIYEFEDFIMKKTEDCKLDRSKKRNILQHFCDSYNINFMDVNQLCSKFESFSDIFFRFYLDLDEDLKNRILLHNCGLDNYLKYIDYAKRLYDMGVHSPDCKILVDAYDLSLISSQLTFVSFDEKLMNILLKGDVSFLNVIEFKSC